MQIIVHSPNNIQIVTNSAVEECEHRNEFVLDNNQQLQQSQQSQQSQHRDDDAAHACSMAMISIIKVGILTTIMYISFMFIQCGIGKNNMLCTQ